MDSINNTGCAAICWSHLETIGCFFLGRTDACHRARCCYRGKPLAVDVDRLYRRYGPFVLRRCRRMLGDEQQACEAMQDVFVQVLRRQDTMEDKGLGGLLYRTATNVCLNRLRSRARKPQSPASDMLHRVPAAERHASQAEARNLLATALADEPESSATIIALHLHDGLTLEQTARFVGMSVSGVRHRLRTLRAKLQELRDDG